MLRKMAQQGKQQSSKMRMPLWSMTPTRFKFLPPKDLEKQCFSEHGGQGLTLPAGPAGREGEETGCQAPASQVPLWH